MARTARRPAPAWAGPAALRLAVLVSGVLGCATLGLATGCGSDHRGAGTPAPSPAPTAPAPSAPATAPAADPTDAAGPLCALLSGADFHALANLPAGPTLGGGSATQATCEYGANLQLIVSVSPTEAEADSFYRSMLRSAWFTSNLRNGPVPGADASTYGNGPDAAALAVRRQKLVLTVVVPGANAEATLVQLAGRALGRAANLGP